MDVFIFQDSGTATPIRDYDKEIENGNKNGGEKKAETPEGKFEKRARKQGRREII
jgi:hypothetical protein